MTWSEVLEKCFSWLRRLCHASSLTGMNGCLMVQWQKMKQRRRSFSSHGWLGGCVAVWQAAKKDLSHSPYVTCFPNASAVRICYQPAPADGLGVLNCSLLTISFSFSYLPLSSSPTLCPACVTCHLDVIADKRKLMHVESTAAPTHTHKQKSHPLICQ